MKDNKLLIAKIIAFYKLEEFQVAFYKAQVSSAKNEYFRRAFSKMVAIENTHAKFFAQQLNELNIPVPKVTGSLFTLAGAILGETVELTGSFNICRLGIILENHAMKMYQRLIEESKGYPDLYNTLWEYYLDEEFHTLWLKNYISLLMSEQ